MKSRQKKVAMDKEKKEQYPETVGSRLAEKARRLANSLSDDKRESHLHKALAIIYGSSGKKTVSVRR
ncbi:MAG TPA: hypothetical protein VL171_01475 [Verrucomicrobiae bacterium]|nr:hypothetical protein [Verrucomicrobiae bacterium]